MKIDKNNPRHWFYLLLMGVNAVMAVVLRPLLHQKNQKPKQVLLYGHKLNGNLLAIHNHLCEHAGAEFDVAFLTMDKAYYRQLQAEGINCVLATRPQAIKRLSTVDAIISDHGLHCLSVLINTTDIKFIDVWHGFGFKGHEWRDFRVLRRYTEAWVSSPLQRQFYLERFGFKPNIVKATGYARADRLVRQNEDVGAIRRKLGLEAPGTGKLVLFAPTWTQDLACRSMFPFGLTADQFLRALSDTAQRTQSTVIVRAHLNTGIDSQTTYPRLVFIPYASYPDTEAMLLVSDILVADWSSIVFDWLLLNRPTLFLDVEVPFTTGHTLDPSYRYGDIVSNMAGLQKHLEQYLRDEQAYHTKHGEQMQRIRDSVFGGCADGSATARCVERLRRLLGA